MSRMAPKYFLPYLIYDKRGYWAGFRDDAPEEAKKEYEEYTKPKYIDGIPVCY